MENNNNDNEQFYNSLEEYSKINFHQRFKNKEESKDNYFYTLKKVALAYGTNPQHSERIFRYATKGWLSFATPIIANAPLRVKYEEKFENNFKTYCFKEKYGLPISCYLLDVQDDSTTIMNHYKELALLAKNGGGVGSSFSSLREIGAKIGNTENTASGIVPYLKIEESVIAAFNQSENRRGATAVYLSIDHPEIEEFIQCREPTGAGDHSRQLLYKGFHHAVVVNNSFLDAVKKDKTYPLISRKDGSVVKEVSARQIWNELLLTRHRRGEPYIMNIDVANEYNKNERKDSGLVIKQSNLCSEIFIPTNHERSAVCCLSSLNLETYDEWKGNEQFIADVIEFLDNVLEYFIEDTKDVEGFEKTNFAALMGRDLGLGQMGWHYYLQKNNLPFDCEQSRNLLVDINKFIYDTSVKASKNLGIIRGECPDMKGSGMRNANLIAIAPNVVSALNLGTSHSIEPFKANVYLQGGVLGTFVRKNKYFDKLLKTKYKETYDKRWVEISQNKGSILDLDYTDEEKELFRCADEIDQIALVDQAILRQEFVDQGQSVNLFYPPTTKLSDLNKAHYKGARYLKSLYYLKTDSVGTIKNVSKETDRNIIETTITNNKENCTDEICIVCQS